MILLLDICGSLTDAHDRFVKAGMEPNREYREAHDAWLAAVQSEESLMADPPNPLMQRLVQRMSAAPNTKIIYLTARSENFAPVTLRWLKRYNYPNGLLIMRSLQELRASEDYKVDEIKKIQRQFPNEQILTIDDDPSGRMAPAYKQLAVMHLKPTWCCFDEFGAPNPAYAR